MTVERVVDPASWASQQQDKYAARRRFIRDFLLNSLAFNIVVKPTVAGYENIPASGGAIILINHVTAVDPMIVTGVIRHRYLMMMTKIENFESPLVGLLARNWGCYPVRRGEVDRQALNTTLDLLALGELVLIAPEGTRAPALQPAKEGAAYVALKSNCPIIPTAIYNAETWLRYFLLPRRTQVQVKFGKPFRFKETGRKRVSREEMEVLTAQMMYQLAALLPEKYRGVYADLSHMQTDQLDFL